MNEEYENRKALIDSALKKLSRCGCIYNQLTFFKKERVYDDYENYGCYGYTYHYENRRYFAEDLTRDEIRALVKDDGDGFIIKFGKVNNFDCSNMGLKSLVNAPKEATTFNCSYNNLTSLAHGPIEATKSYDCSHNNITSLEGVIIKTDKFDISYNNLKSLKGNKVSIYEHIYNRNSINVSHNKLTSLEGIRMYTDTNLDCSSNELKNLAGLPKFIAGDLNISDNKLKSLKDLPRINGHLWCLSNPDLHYRKSELNKGRRAIFSIEGINDDEIKEAK